MLHSKLIWLSSAGGLPRRFPLDVKVGVDFRLRLLSLATMQELRAHSAVHSAAQSKGLQSLFKVT